MSSSAEIKQKIKIAKQELKLAKKKERELRKSRDGSFAKRLGEKIDAFNLSFYERYEGAAARLRLKQSDRPSYDALNVLEDSQDVLKRLEAKKNKKKPFSIRDKEVLGKLYVVSGIFKDNPKLNNDVKQKVEETIGMIGELSDSGAELAKLEKELDLASDISELQSIFGKLINQTTQDDVTIEMLSNLSKSGDSNDQ